MLKQTLYAVGENIDLRKYHNGGFLDKEKFNKDAALASLTNTTQYFPTMVLAEDYALKARTMDQPCSTIFDTSPAIFEVQVEPLKKNDLFYVADILSAKLHWSVCKAYKWELILNCPPLQLNKSNGSPFTSSFNLPFVSSFSLPFISFFSNSSAEDEQLICTPENFNGDFTKLQLKKLLMENAFTFFCANRSLKQHGENYLLPEITSIICKYVIGQR